MLPEAQLQPHKIDNSRAFMVETRQVLSPTRHALDIPRLQRNYDTCWHGIRKQFNGAHS